MYVIMVLVAGLTALYTTAVSGWSSSVNRALIIMRIRLDLAMKIALAPLALAALVSWLVVGRFSVLLGESACHIMKLNLFR